MTHPDYQKQIGESLRIQRERMQFSLEAASAQLYIRAKYLQALEEGQLEVLPGQIYLKGYLQSYAQFLDLDKDEIFRRFEQLGNLPDRKGFQLPEILSKEKTPSRGLVKLTLGLCVVFLVVLMLVAAAKPKPPSPIDTPPVKEPEKIVGNLLETLTIPCSEVGLAYYPPCTSNLSGLSEHLWVIRAVLPWR